MNNDTNALLNQLITKVDNLKQDIDKEFKEVKTQLNELDKSVIKLDERIAGVDKRLSNEETISRTALGAIFGGVSIAAIKYLFFLN